METQKIDNKQNAGEETKPDEEDVKTLSQTVEAYLASEAETRRQLAEFLEPLVREIYEGSSGLWSGSEGWSFTS